MTASLPPGYHAVGLSSFVDFLATSHPDRLPASTPARLGDLAPHGTTIVAVRTHEGVVMAGDRRATMGNLIAQNDIEKVFVADDATLIGIAGTAGLAIELVRLFQVELEHYEKIEGVPLSLDGKANRLASLLRSSLGLALQGLAVVPMLAGFDTGARRGRIFSYDVTGGRYEERDLYAVGSGSSFARGSLKKLYRRDIDSDSAIAVVLEALYDAADDDSATGGPDAARGIYPVVGIADAEGARLLDDGDVAVRVQAMLADRTSSGRGSIG